ncbi:MAG: hypothetical protein JWM86_1901 [Thermoleophilia bacterium]|nr:hypothetical protein [Thermoleophilia bacterium]
MDFASSYAVGGPQPGHGSATPRGAAEPVVLPAPRPQKLHWSTLLFIGGLAICVVGLLATIAGVPGKLGYDVDGAPNRNKPDSMDPLKISQSLDGNMKWIAENSSDDPTSYVGYIKSINRSEAAIPAMVSALVTMNASVEAIDSGLGNVGATTTEMKEQIAALGAVSARSADTMESLNTDIGFLSGSMLGLAGSTQELTKRMAAIEAKAGSIAKGGTSAALANTKALNASLPGEVPIPTTDDGRPLDVVMRELATQGGGAGEAAPTTGAQPARPADAWEARAGL